MQRLKIYGLGAMLALGLACSGGTPNPASPSAGGGAGGSDANADGTTLKVLAPGTREPQGRVRVENLKPTLTWTNAEGRFQDAPFQYYLELYKENTLERTILVNEASGAQTSYTFTDDLLYDTLYRWRVRAQLQGAFGPFSATADFFTPLPPRPEPGKGTGQPFGPIRDIGVGEALGLIVAYHDLTGANLGSGSSRQSRIDFLFSAVAIVHYGHPSLNPAGGDRNWCVKDAGGGRPPSDDVLVRCNSRDAWDLIGGAGGPGYTFHLDYIGRLPGDQNVYPPPLSALP